MESGFIRGPSPTKCSGISPEEKKKKISSIGIYGAVFK